MSLDVTLYQVQEYIHGARIRKEVYSANITHNLAPMAQAVGIYKELWRPEKVGVTTAKQLIEPLEKGFDLLRAEPVRFGALNPGNGWGTYEGFVEFVESYLHACRQWPDAEVEADR